MFERAVARGEMRPLDVELATTVFGGMAMAVVHGHHGHRRPQPGDDIKLVDIFLNGIAPTRNARSRNGSIRRGRGQPESRQ
jgi:hypothetical protein